MVQEVKKQIKKKQHIPSEGRFMYREKKEKKTRSEPRKEYSDELLHGLRERLVNSLLDKLIFNI